MDCNRDENGFSVWQAKVIHAGGEDGKLDHGFFLGVGNDDHAAVVAIAFQPQFMTKSVVVLASQHLRTQSHFLVGCCATFSRSKADVTIAVAAKAKMNVEFHESASEMLSTASPIVIAKPTSAPIA